MRNLDQKTALSLADAVVSENYITQAYSRLKAATREQDEFMVGKTTLTKPEADKLNEIVERNSERVAHAHLKYDAALEFGLKNTNAGRMVTRYMEANPTTQIDFEARSERAFQKSQQEPSMENLQAPTLAKAQSQSTELGRLA